MEDQPLIPSKKILNKKDKEKPGPKTEHRYTDRFKTKCFELYCSFDSSLSKVSERMNISVATLKLWRKKYNWDRIIAESAVKAVSDIHSNSEKLDRTLQSISEKDAYRNLALTQEANQLPDVLMNSKAPARSESYKNLLSQIAEVKIIEEEFKTLKELDSIVKESLNEQRIRPQNWSDVMNGMNFITKRYDKLIERVIKIKEIEAREEDRTEIAELYDEKGQLVRASNEFFSGELGSSDEEEMLEEEYIDYPEEDDEEVKIVD